MIQHFEAVYEHGVLRLKTPLDVPDSTRVSGLVTNSEHLISATASEQPSTSLEAFVRDLDEFSIPLGKHLPESFSRADIYVDHD